MSINNVIQLHAEVTVPSNVLMADAVLANLIECAKQQQKMLKAQELAFKILTDQVREAMGSYETVIGLNGEIAATYNWVKGAETVDTKALKLNFADVYEVCKKIGDAKRRLELK
jgi:predicted phage-related endonuclease